MKGGVFVKENNNERSRMCLNCKYRIEENASSFCTYGETKTYMHYEVVFDGWCPHWSKGTLKNAQKKEVSR